MLSEIIRGTKTTLPANAKGQRMWYSYRYEPVMNMYVSRIDDAFGYSSEAGNFDYRYGMALRRTDLNRLNYETDLDNEPRLSLWMSTDSRSEEAPEAPEASSYTYSHNAPTGRVDFDGKWDIKVSASSDRANHPYAIYAVYDRNGNLIYKTVVKVLGSYRKRNSSNADTPQGRYKILGWRKTGTKHYPTISFGPNDLLALEYQGGEGGTRQGMHTHGGRRQKPGLMGTQGCMRMADADIKELKEMVTQLEKNDPNEKKGFLTLKDDLQVPVSYNDRDKIKEEVNEMKSYELPEVVVIGHRTQKVEKNETKKGGTKHETEQ